jgi:hypothetical protein
MKPNIVRRLAFVGLVIVGTIALTQLDMVLARVIATGLGQPFLDFGAFAIQLGALNLVLVFIGGVRILKWFGYSRSGNTRETQSRILAKAEADVDDGEAIEIHGPESVTRQALLLWLFAWLLFAVALFLAHGSTLVIIMFILGVLGTFRLWLSYMSNGFQVRADCEGILGLPVGFHVRRRIVPWSDIESCEIVTYYNTFGDPTRILPVFKDRLGTKVLSLDLSMVMPSDGDRLVKYIKAKLPKSPIESFEV